MIKQWGESYRALRVKIASLSPEKKEKYVAKVLFRVLLYSVPIYLTVFLFFFLNVILTLFRLNSFILNIVLSVAVALALFLIVFKVMSPDKHIKMIDEINKENR